jgi:RNA polymerase sigma-70 factor (ECF subfamily)
VTEPAGREERDQIAFERSVAPEVRRLYRIALAILDDGGEAEDAVQETLLSAWRRWPSIQAFANPSAWLTQVCVNHSIHRRRRLVRRILWSREQWSRVTPGLPDLEGQLLDFHRALSVLSSPQRAVFVLHIQDGFSLDECATLLGCRPGTARSHLGRAVAKLRKELNDA